MNPIRRPIACTTSTGSAGELPAFSSLAFWTMCIQYLATEPKPGVWSISLNSLSPTSLSIVLGTPTATRSKPFSCAKAATLWAVSIESLPPM